MDIFCNVIDNFGDAGFSLRLARSLTKQQIRVNLFCDYLPAIECLLSNEDCQNNFLKIGLWPDPCIYVPSDTVIEAFSCRLPDKLLSKIKIKIDEIYCLFIEILLQLILLNILNT